MVYCARGTKQENGDITCPGLHSRSNGKGGNSHTPLPQPAIKKAWDGVWEKGCTLVSQF